MFGKKNSEINFVDENLKNTFDRLKDSSYEEKRLHEWLLRAFRDIQENAFCGTQISKKLMPSEFIKNYGIKNLWKYNLPNAWRLLYSIEAEEIKIVSIILEWMNHMVKQVKMLVIEICFPYCKQQTYNNCSFVV
ncbi:MAG: hypothetical protein V1870_04880 [Candidatus Aenigmatarchaeota archaeon]